VQYRSVKNRWSESTLAWLAGRASLNNASRCYDDEVEEIVRACASIREGAAKRPAVSADGPQSPIVVEHIRYAPLSSLSRAMRSCGSVGCLIRY
jgi:hypothetical protein